MDKILLHICCGICCSPAIERLKEEGFEVAGLFYNPNIAPEDEYLRRLKTAKDVADIYKIKLVEVPYEAEKWINKIKGRENDAEGGERCALCYSLRLEYASKMAKELGIKFFTTTLTISPHKDSKLINSIGKSIDNIGFKDYDFKKKDGFKKAIAFAKQLNLYRQDYCGCLYSKKPVF